MPINTAWLNKRLLCPWLRACGYVKCMATLLDIRNTKYTLN